MQTLNTSPVELQQQARPLVKPNRYEIEILEDKRLGRGVVWDSLSPIHWQTPLGFALAGGEVPDPDGVTFDARSWISFWHRNSPTTTVGLQWLDARL